MFNVINLLRKLWCNASLCVVTSTDALAFLQNRLLLHCVISNDSIFTCHWALHMYYGLLQLQPFYNHFTAPWTVSGTTRMSRYQKGKTNLDLLEQEIVNDSGISWAICKSAPRPDMPASHHLFFTGRMPFLPPNQQCQSTEAYSLITFDIYEFNESC